MLERARLGMAMFLLNEAVFFFMLIAAFVYFRDYFRDPTAPQTGQTLNFGAGIIYTACLAASSFTMWRATASVERVRAWVSATILLGAVFLAGQAGEYARLFRQNITINQNTFGTTLFMLTGFHGLHVVVGILLLGLALFVSRIGDRVAVEAVALYWYFVAAVWLAIFSVVYLWAFL